MQKQIMLKRIEGKSYSSISKEVGVSRQRCHEIFPQPLKPQPPIAVALKFLLNQPKFKQAFDSMLKV